MARAPSCLPAFALLAGCAVTPIERDAEIARFQDSIGTKLDELNLHDRRVLSLRECEEIALAGNLQYRVALLEARLSDENVRIAYTKMLPNLDTEFRRVERSNEPLVEAGGQSSNSGSSPAGQPTAESQETEFAFEDQEIDTFRVGAVIPILDFGATRYAWHVAKDRRMQQRLALVRARQTLLRDVRVFYVRLAAATHDAELLRAEVAAHEEALRVAESFLREGIIAPSDVAMVEAGLARSRLDLTLAERDVLLAKARLSRVLSIPSLVDYQVEPLPDQLPPLPGSLDDVRRLEDLALNRRPEAWSQDRARDAAASQVRQRIAEFFPRLDGLVEFHWTSNSRVVNSSYYNVGFSVAHSLLDGGASIFRYRAAEHEAVTEEERALLVQMGIVFEVDFRILELARATDGLAAREKLVAAREKSFALVAARAREGLESGAELARSLADLHGARRDRAANRADVLVALHELDAATAADSSDLPERAAEALPEVGSRVPVSDATPSAEREVP